MELDVWIEFDSNEMDNWKGGEWSKTMSGSLITWFSIVNPKNSTIVGI